MRVAGCFACLSAYPGVDHGLPAAVMTRMSLGFPWGTWLSSVCSVLSLVGWYAVQAELAGVAADSVLSSVTGLSSPMVMIALMSLLNIYFAVMGFGWMQSLASWSVPGLLLLSAWLFVTIAMQYPFMDLVTKPGEGPMTFLQAMNITVGAQIAGSFTISDLSRYARNHRSVWLGILLAISPVSAFMMALGALSRLASGNWNPVLAVESLGLGIPAMLLIIFATWTTNDKNLYSGGLALTNLIPNQPRWRLTLALGLVGTVLGCFRVTRFFTQWLVALGIVFAPLLGIVLADYFVVRRRRPLVADAYRAEGRYFYTSGINLAALAAIGIGVVAGRLATPEMLQPVVSLFATGLTYVVGMRVIYPQQFQSAGALAAAE